MKLTPLPLVATLALVGAMPAQATVVINYSDFSDTSGLTLNGDAAQVGNALRVTPAVDWKSGSVFSSSTVSLAAGASFSTHFGRIRHLEQRV